MPHPRCDKLMQPRDSVSGLKQPFSEKMAARRTVDRPGDPFFSGTLAGRCGLGIQRTALNYPLLHAGLSDSTTDQTGFIIACKTHQCLTVYAMS